MEIEFSSARLDITHADYSIFFDPNVTTRSHFAAAFRISPIWSLSRFTQAQVQRSKIFNFDWK